MKSKVIYFCLFSLAMFAFNVHAQNMVTVSGKVTSADDNEPLIGANLSIQGAFIGAATQSDGSYELKVAPGTYTIIVKYIGYTIEKAVIKVSVDEPVIQDFVLKEDVLQLSEIVATGTRFSGRTVTESVAPIDVISAKEIHATGLTQTTQVLQQLVPSYNAPQPSITDGSDHMSPATLRGLGPDQVLILVNGKRRHTSALVHVNGSVGRGSTGADLNSIPPNAIEKIEVLRDGAAAQYGSDAISGVINLVLKESMGFDGSISYSQYISSVTRGYSEGELNLNDGSDNYSWDGSGLGGPESIDYRDGNTLNLHLGYGFEVAQDGQFYVSGQLRSRDKAVRAGLDPRQQYFDGDPNEASFDRLNHAYGQGEFTDYSLFFNGSMPLEGIGKFYAFGGYNDREGSTGCYYRRANDNRTVRAIHPDGFLPTLDNRLKDLSLSAGIKGNLGKWNYDLSETFGSNSFQFIVGNTNNVSLGAESPTKFDAGTLKFRQATTNFDMLRELDISMTSPLNIAVGAELRWENYQIEAGEESSYINGLVPILDGGNVGNSSPVGASCFPGFSPENATDEQRTNVAAYIDLENKLTDQLLVTVASRFESYSDFGETLNGKIAGRFEFIDGVALRGAASTGFRAPSLAQAHYSAIATNFIDGVPFEVGTFPVTHPVAQAFGAKDLEPEKSVNFSAGLTVSQSNFALTADIYQINIDDRIVFTENFTGAGVAEYLATQNINANGGRFFTNAVNTKTQGLDIIAKYGIRFGEAKLRFVAALGFNKTEITNKDAIQTPDVLKNYTGKVLFGRVEQGRFEHGQPRQKHNLTANFDLDRFSIMTRAIFYGEVTSFNSGDPNPATGINLRDETFGAKWINDVEVSYQLMGDISWAIGANNLFDIYPDKQLKANSFNGIFPYAGLSPFGFFGRNIYTRLNFSL